MKYVIFAIDNPTPYRKAVFASLINTNPNMTGNMVQCVGRYDGVDEYSFLMTHKDYLACVEPQGWTRDQESVLMVSECNKMYARLDYADGRKVGIGSLHSVTEQEALASGGFTYRPDVDRYYVAKHGNPDGSYSESRRRTLAGDFDEAPMIEVA